MITRPASMLGSMAAKKFEITVQAEVSEPKSIISKEITNFDFTNVSATQAREESKKITSTDFKSNPKHFTISDGNITIPVDLTWDIPLSERPLTNSTALITYTQNQDFVHMSRSVIIVRELPVLLILS